MPRLSPGALAALILAALCGAELAAIVALTGGHVLFSQDDPYIHLALAERLAMHGHYGLNPGEAVAPASSILYPFLLVPFVWLGMGQAGALLICTGATMASGALVCAILQAAGYDLAALPRATLALLVAAVALAFNLAGLAFTGLENALHVAVSLACVLGMLRFLQTGRIAPWWLAVTFAVPLVRYEGASFMLATVLLLAWHRRWAPAVALLAASIASLGAFSLFLIAHGLPPLPSSVLVKLDAPATGAAGMAGAWHMLLTTLSYNVVSYGFPQLLGLAVLLALGCRAALREGDAMRVQLALFGLAVIAAHMVVGRFGWFGRYEIYILLSAACLVAAVWAPRMAPGTARLRGAALATLLIWLLAPMAEYPWRTLETPLGARNIYDQQHQMGRFATGYWRRPVAVNDLGQVSYGNPNYVLDLWGLGSDEARRARARGAGAPWIDAAARRHGALLAMLTPEWFAGQIPADWVLVGTLTLKGPMATTITRGIGFYATTPDAAPAIREALESFALTLPAEDGVVFP